MLSPAKSARYLLTGFIHWYILNPEGDCFTPEDPLQCYTLLVDSFVRDLMRPRPDAPET
jgi:hypothetical protein